MTTVVLGLLSGLAVMMAGCTERGDGQPPPPAAPRDEGGTKPVHALLIASRSASGCLISQKLVADLSKKLGAGESVSAVIEPKSAAEDLEESNDLYLAFEEPGRSRITGLIVARVSTKPETEGEKPRFVVNSARMKESGGKRTLNIDGKGNGALTVSILYARTLTLEQAWFSCPESGEREPYALTFIPAFAPEGLDERTMAQSARGKSSFTFEITANVLRALFPVDQALTVLNEITKRFGTKESRFVLDMAKLTPNALRAAAAGGKVKTQVAVIPDSGPQLLVGDENFDPTLRQKVAIRTASGSIVGAELRIRVDE